MGDTNWLLTKGTPSYMDYERNTNSVLCEPKEKRSVQCCTHQHLFPTIHALKCNFKKRKQKRKERRKKLQFMSNTYLLHQLLHTHTWNGAGPQTSARSWSGFDTGRVSRFLQVEETYVKYSSFRQT